MDRDRKEGDEFYKNLRMAKMEMRKGAMTSKNLRESRIHSKFKERGRERKRKGGRSEKRDGKIERREM